MKKSFIYAGAILAATISLTNCTKEINSSEAALPEGIPFEICANPTTKTTVEGLSTKWAAGDGINVFHAAAGTKEYVSDNEFTIAGDLADGRFTGALSAALGEGTYDWYAFYPYSKYNKTPAGSSQDDFGFTTIGGTSQTQIGNNSTAHLCGTVCPLYGVAKSVASSATPGITMKHLTSIIEVNVTNNSGKDLSVSSVSFTGTEDIVGTYYINFTQTPVVYTSRGETYVSNTASLSVTGGETIADGASAKFYIAIKPFTAPDGSSLTLSVNGYKKKVTLTKDIAFTAGHIKTLGFEFDKVQTDYIELPWTEDFSEDLSKYTLTNGGTTTKIFDEASAGGKAPELLISKNNGSFSAKIKAVAGEYLLTFKSNHPEYLTVSTSSDAVNVAKVHDNEYTITIPDGLDYFTLALKNTDSRNNTRVDDIAMFVDERVALQAPANLMADLVKGSPNSIEVVWEAVENAGSYVVTATPTTGDDVSETVTATSCTIKGLAYEMSYTISVVAKPSNPYKYFDSPAAEYGPISTGEKPSTDGVTYTLLFGAKYNSKGISSYTSSWSATNDGFTCNLENWNNNNNQWNYVKAGNKSSASIATITTNAVIAEAIKTVTVTIDAVTTSSINSITLYRGDSADACNESLGKFSVAKGEQSIVINTPTANKYYKISFDCKKGSSNGLVQVSKVIYKVTE